MAVTGEAAEYVRAAGIGGRWTWCCEDEVLVSEPVCSKKYKAESSAETWSGEMMEI